MVAGEDPQSLPEPGHWGFGDWSCRSRGGGSDGVRTREAGGEARGDAGLDLGGCGKGQFLRRKVGVGVPPHLPLGENPPLSGGLALTVVGLWTKL